MTAGELEALSFFAAGGTTASRIAVLYNPGGNSTVLASKELARGSAEAR